MEEVVAALRSRGRHSGCHGRWGAQLVHAALLLPCLASDHRLVFGQRLLRLCGGHLKDFRGATEVSLLAWHSVGLAIGNSLAGTLFQQAHAFHLIKWNMLYDIYKESVSVYLSLLGRV